MSLTTVRRMHNWRHHICFAVKQDDLPFQYIVNSLLSYAIKCLHVLLQQPNFVLIHSGIVLKYTKEDPKDQF